MDNGGSCRRRLLSDENEAAEAPAYAARMSRSAAFFEMVGPIGEMLGADRVAATRLVVADGRYTGAVAFSAYGPHKAEAIRELAERQGYDLAASYGYSDSATDVPMLELVGHPTAVNPDRALRRIAAERGWPVLSFARPVPLRRHATRPGPLGSAVGGTVVGLVAGAGLAWYVRRRPART